MALMPTERMGPTARSFPTGQARGLKAHADAHDCIMVRIQTDLPHTSVRREIRANGELPSDHPQKERRHRQTLELPKRGLALAGHPPSAFLAVKALQNTRAAKRQAAKLC
jgi:hypothetical protein